MINPESASSEPFRDLPPNIEELLRKGDLSVTEVCFAVGCQSLGTFSTRLTELVGVPPSVYRQEAARATEGLPACVAKQVTRPVRNQEARSARAS